MLRKRLLGGMCPHACHILRFTRLYSHGPTLLYTVQDRVGYGCVPTRENLQECDDRRRYAIAEEAHRSKEGKLTADFVDKCLVQKSFPDLKKFEYVHLWEWQVPSIDAGAKGDLVLASGCGDFAVVEVKALHLESSGKTVRRRRTMKRTQLAHQAISYTGLFADFSERLILCGIRPVVSGWMFSEDGLKNAFNLSWCRGLCQECQRCIPQSACYPELLPTVHADSHVVRCQRCSLLLEPNAKAQDNVDI